MKSTKRIAKEEEILALTKQVEALNNQIGILEEQSIALSLKIQSAHRQLELIKSQEGIIYGS